MKSSEVQQHADFSRIRYAFCWEDADILVAALEPAGKHCLSIGSAGDNALALLAADAREVCVAEMNPAQIACLQLRIAAFTSLEHSEMLALLGQRDSHDRLAIYERCRRNLPDRARIFWDSANWKASTSPAADGKFERYFSHFRRFVLPLCHSRRRVEALLQSREKEARIRFHDEVWDNRRWRLLFALFFSRTVMGRLGRDPAFFRYVEGSVASRIRKRTRHALTELDPSQNPYLRSILTGEYGSTLPMALRAKNFETIRNALREDRLTIQEGPLETVDEGTFDAFNLSDIFEYMSEEATETLLRQIHAQANPGARLAYWNMLAPRSRPESLAHLLQPLEELSDELFHRDKAFFYNRFVVEEVIS